MVFGMWTCQFTNVCQMRILLRGCWALPCFPLPWTVDLQAPRNPKPIFQSHRFPRLFSKGFLNWKYKIAKCHSFLVSWLLGFIVSCFQFKVSKLQSFDDPILPAFSFHVFMKILIPYSRFSRICKTDLHEFRVPVCSNIFKVFDFPYHEIYLKKTCPKMS